ncbi:nitroreductase [bacterium]|nr:nitroreductase [bacterium]
MNDLIAKRYSSNDFDPDFTLTEEQVQTLFEAARWAPSSRNEQPWKYFYATRQNTSGFEKVFSIVDDASNRAWCGNASLLICGVTNTEFKRNGKPNRHAFYDLGQSVISLVLQAVEMGLYVHQMGGFSQDIAREVLQLSANQEPVVMIAIGQRLGTDTPQNRNRKPLDEVAVELK